MNTTHMEYFLAVAESLSFTHAAEALYIAQPALSRIISALEDEVGVKLLVRSTRNVSLTAAGEAFLNDCRKIVSACEDSKTRAKYVAQGYAGKITMGLLRAYFEKDIVDLLLDFTQTHPNIKLDMHWYTQSRLLQAFSVSEVDLIVGYKGIPASPDIESVIFDAPQECVIVSYHHPLAGRESVRIEEFAGADFLIMSRAVSSQLHDTALKMVTDAGITPNIVEYMPSVISMLMKVACSHMVAIASSHLAANVSGKVRFIPIEGKYESPRAFAWWKDNKNPSMKHLIENIKKRYLG